MMENNTKNTSLFSSSLILAPMVRAGRTPLRTLALDYGADLVYTEEIVDQKLLGSRRIENSHLGTVDFINGIDVVLRIAPVEKAKCVLQIGTNSAENAAKVCRRFSPEVAAIDLNMGCPKPFSVHAGMGAALLKDPVKVEQILTAMVASSQVPISCKIRVLDSHEKTMEFVRMVERCGVSALAVHGRRRDERPGHECRVNEIRDISHCLHIPVIANGGSQEMHSHDDIHAFRTSSGASSVMVARKALTSPSIFRKEGILPMDEEIHNFLAKACLYEENFTATKYALQRMLGSQQEHDPRGRGTVAAGTVREICRVWGMEDRLEECRRRRGAEECEEEGNGGEGKRPRMGGGGCAKLELVNGIWSGQVSFALKKLKHGLNGAATPKCVLNSFCRERRLPAPHFETVMRPEDSRFTAVVRADGKQFTSPLAQPNIKMAEQVAALVALHGLGIRQRLEGEWEEDF